MRTIEIRTHQARQLLDVTRRVQAVVGDLDDGAFVLYSPHTTCGVTINEGADPDVARDITHYLERLVPRDYPSFRHAEGNSDAHVLTTLVGSSVVVPVEGGRPRLGRWQALYLAEFDGPRQRTLWILPLRDVG